MMDMLTPYEIIEHLDQIIESLTEQDDAYECVDIAIRLRDEIIEALQITIDY